MARKETSKETGMVKSSPSDADLKRVEEVASQFDELLARVNKNKPDPKDIEAFRSILAENKDLKLWSSFPGPGQTAENIALNSNECLPDSCLIMWGYRQKAMLVELGFENASALERLIIQQITLCWLRLNLLEILYTISLEGSHTPEVGLYYEKRLTATQKRFTRACETLARVRRSAHLLPSIQINVAKDGGQQVNVAPGKG